MTPSSSARAFAGLVVALGAIAVGASAQRRVRGELRLTVVDDAVDRASVRWVAPTGTETRVCSDAEVASAGTCALASFHRGAGDYRLEAGAAGARHALGPTLSLRGDELAVDVHVRRGHVHIAILEPAPPHLQIRRAPPSLRSDVCRYVIRNGGPAREHVPLDAWVETPSRVAPDWTSHGSAGYGTRRLDPGEQRCLSLHPDGATPRLGSLAVYVPRMIADTVGYTASVSITERISGQFAAATP